MALDTQIKGNKIFAPLLNKWLPATPEEKVRQEYICRLVNDYKFSLEQISQDYSYNDITERWASADILVWKNVKDKKSNNKPLIVIECKAEQITIKKEDYYRGTQYAKDIGAKFFVATNERETRIFSKIYKLDKEGNEIKLNELLNIPNAEEARNEKSIEELLNKTVDFARDDFNKKLLRCHNIIRNNDKLSPEAAFDEISKVLFVKILKEKKDKRGQVYTSKVYKLDKDLYEDKFKKKDDKEYYKTLFDEVKENYEKEKLFDVNESIKIKENSFESIIKELEGYNLALIDEDIKGLAFENFLGKTFRGELGQFFTPRKIVEFMTKVLDPEDGETICDPCCGSGGFLINAYNFIREKIDNEIISIKEVVRKHYYTSQYENATIEEKNRIEGIINSLFDKINNYRNERMHFLSEKSIYGTDANPRMSHTAKMNMIMQGDGHGGVHHRDGLLNINGIFENRFDVILTNPPFGARVDKALMITEADKITDKDLLAKYEKEYGEETYQNAMKQIDDNVGESLLSIYKTGAMTGLTEVLFIERCLNLLKPGGRMGIVLPEGVLNNPNLQKVRDYVETKAKILLVVSIPQDVFIASGATVKPSLMFFKKFTEKEEKEYKEIMENVHSEISNKYKLELDEIKKQLNKKNIDAENRRKLKAKQKTFINTVESEEKNLIKERFNYTVPIAEIERAGISSTGAETENDLIPLEQEYTKYRKKNKLWDEKRPQGEYYVADDTIFRMVTGEKKMF